MVTGFLDKDGAAFENALASGGEDITITGYNFGPVSSYAYGKPYDLAIGDLTYGPRDQPTRYRATNCTVLSHTKIKCLTAPGSGNLLYWKVTIKGQTSEDSPACASKVEFCPSMGYARPSILYVSPPEGPTAGDTQVGGFLVTITGTNFGDNPSLFLGTEDSPVTDVDDGTGTMIPSKTTSVFNTPIVGEMITYMTTSSDCPLAPCPHHNVTFALPVGYGTAVPIQLLPEGGKLRGPAQSYRYSYLPPIVSDLAIQSDEGSGTMDISIYGSNFGSAALFKSTGGDKQRVLYNSTDIADSINATCSVALTMNCIVPKAGGVEPDWDHNRIKIRVTRAKQGWIQVAVGDVSALPKKAVATWAQNWPALYSCEDGKNNMDDGKRPQIDAFLDTDSADGYYRNPGGWEAVRGAGVRSTCKGKLFNNDQPTIQPQDKKDATTFKSLYDCATLYDGGVGSATTASDFKNIECEYARVYPGFNNPSSAKVDWLPVGDVADPIDEATFGSGLPTQGGHMLVIEGVNLGKLNPGDDTTATTYSDCAYGCLEDPPGVYTAQLPKVYVGEVAATLGGKSVPCKWPRDPKHCTPATGDRPWDVELDGDCCYQECDLKPYLDPLNDPKGAASKKVKTGSGYPRWVGPGSRVRVACAIPPGQGQLDVWAASEANIFSVEHKIRYAAPTVTWPLDSVATPMKGKPYAGVVNAFTSNTDGSLVFLNGTNLGFNPFVDVHLNGDVKVTEISGLDETIKTTRSKNIAVNDAHTGLSFEMAPGQGLGHEVVLTVGGRAVTSGGTWRVDYNAPAIYSIVVDSEKDTNLRLDGANFGEVGLGTHNFWLGDEECVLLSINHTALTVARYCSDEFVARCTDEATDACGSYTRAYELLLGKKILLNVSAQIATFDAPVIAKMDYDTKPATRIAGLTGSAGDGYSRETNPIQYVYSNIKSSSVARENSAFVQYITGYIESRGDDVELEKMLVERRKEGATCCMQTGGDTYLSLRVWDAGPNPTVTVGSSTDSTAVAQCVLAGEGSRQLPCAVASTGCKGQLTEDELAKVDDPTSSEQIEAFAKKIWLVDCQMEPGLGGVGDLVVGNGALKSSPQKLGYFKPNIDWNTLIVDDAGTIDASCSTGVGYCNQSVTSPDGKSSEFKFIAVSPPGGATFEVTGTNLGGNGNGKLLLQKVNDKGVMTTYAEVALIEHTQTKLRFNISQGEGGYNNIILDVRGQYSDDQQLDYQHPEITDVQYPTDPREDYPTDPRVIGVHPSGCSATGPCNLTAANTKAKTTIVIIGKHFSDAAFSKKLIEAGIESYHVAQIGDAAMECTSWTDTRIECITPEWQGRNLPVRVNVTGIYGDSGASVAVDFEEPSVTSLALFKTVKFGGSRRLVEGFNVDGMTDTTFGDAITPTDISHLYASEGDLSAAKLFGNPTTPRFVCPTEGSDSISGSGASFGYMFKVEGSSLGVHIPQYPKMAREQEWALPSRTYLMAGPNAAGQDTIARTRHSEAIFGCPQDTGRGPYSWRKTPAYEDESSGFLSPAYGFGSYKDAWDVVEDDSFTIHVLAGGKAYGRPSAPTVDGQKYEVGYLPPTVSGVTPQTGHPTSGNTKLTISGSSFGSHYGYSTVFIGDGTQHPSMKYGCSGLCEPADTAPKPLKCCIVSHSHVKMVVRTGAGVGGNHSVSVSTGWGSSLSQNDGKVLPDGSTRSTPIPTFNYDAPVITSIEAVGGSLWPDRAIIIHGTDLGTENKAEPPVSVAIEGISCNTTTYMPATNTTAAYLVCLPGGRSGMGPDKYHVAQEMVLETDNVTLDYTATCYKHTASKPLSEYQGSVGARCPKDDCSNDKPRAPSTSNPSIEAIGGEKCATCPCDFNVTAIVGLQEGPATAMQYDTPQILDVRPNEPNAAQEVLTITGVDFGSDLTTVKDCNSHLFPDTGNCIPHITVHIGDVELRNDLTYTTDTDDLITGGDQAWYESDTRFKNRPIIKVRLLAGKVGIQPMSVNIAGLAYTYNVSTTFVVPGCKKDYYGREDENCEACPQGSTCDGGIKPPYSKEGFWQVQKPFNPSCDPSEDSTCCPPSRATRGYCPVFLPCEPAGACLECKCSGSADTTKSTSDIGQVSGGETDSDGTPIPLCDSKEADDKPNSAGCCSEAYTGDRCKLCSEGYYRLAGVCKGCPKCPICVFLLFLLIAMGGGACLWVLQRKEINLGLIDIGIVYFQVIATFAQTRIRWPAQIIAMYTWMSAFNLNLELLAPECTIAFDYKTKWIVTECIPLIGFTCFVIAHWAKWFQKRCIQNRRNKLHTHIHQMIGTSLILMYFGYLYITKNTLDIFNCGPTDPDDDYEYLEAVFEKCWVNDKEGENGCLDPNGCKGIHLTLLPWAIIFFLVYCVGYPALLGWILWRGKESAREDQLLRAQGKGDKRSENPYYNFRKRYHKLYFNYKPDFVWWILVILLRKFLISVITIIFRRNSLFQMAFMLLVLFAAYAVQVIYRPYMSMSERKQVLEDHEMRMRRMHQDTHAIDAHAHLRGTDHHKKGKRNVRLGDTGVPSLREQGVATANYFFNYNTVEAVLLTSAILIAVSGVMYESDRFDNEDGTKTRYNGQKDSLTACVLLILWGSILYWLTVVVSEIVLTINPELWQKKKEKEEVVKEEDEFEMSHGLNPLHHQASAGNDSAAIAEERLRKAQAEAALGRHKNVIDEQSREILELKKKVQASALSKGDSSTRRVKKDKGKKTKKAFTPVLGDNDDPMVVTPSKSNDDGELFEGEHVI
jgi:hypothetical protein